MMPCEECMYEGYFGGCSIMHYIRRGDVPIDAACYERRTEQAISQYDAAQLEREVL